MTKDAIEPLAPVAPALKARPFLWSRRWLDGPGRWSGRLLILSPIPLAIALFYIHGFLQARACGGDEHTPCLALLRIFMGAIVSALWCIAAACLATLGVRVARALRTSLRGVRARRRVQSFSAECPNLSTADLEPLRALVATHARGPTDEWRARDAAFLIAGLDILVALAAIQVLSFFLGAARADEGVHFHATYDGLMSLLLFLVLLGLVLVVGYLAHVWWRLRKAANELWLDQTIVAERLEADLLRRNQGLDPDRGPAAVFRSFVPRPTTGPSSTPQKH